MVDGATGSSSSSAALSGRRADRPLPRDRRTGRRAAVVPHDRRHRRRRRRQRRLPAASVPVVLLSLGALCLLVAAVVFVAVTWSLLGLTGRTLVLLGVTGLLALVARRADPQGPARSRRDVLARRRRDAHRRPARRAESAGLAGLDALSTGAAPAHSSVVPCSRRGLGVGVWARRQPVGRLYGAESVAVVGCPHRVHEQRVARR